jgi:hypothetical protein
MVSTFTRQVIYGEKDVNSHVTTIMWDPIPITEGLLVLGQNDTREILAM